MVNIAVFVSGGGTNLQAIIDACEKNEINGAVKLVISNKESAYGLTRAQNNNIRGIFTKDEDVILQELKNENIDLIVLAGYLAIVSEKLISEYENVYHSLNDLERRALWRPLIKKIMVSGKEIKDIIFFRYSWTNYTAQFGKVSLVQLFKARKHRG